MTAEQFWPEWAKETYPAICDTSLTGSMTLPFVFKFADAHAAAQLAEKEREIARLKKEVKQWQGISAGNAELAGDMSDQSVEHMQRAEAAEQRLQEAQARIKELGESR